MCLNLIIALAKLRRKSLRLLSISVATQYSHSIPKGQVIALRIEPCSKCNHCSIEEKIQVTFPSLEHGEVPVPNRSHWYLLPL